MPKLNENEVIVPGSLALRFNIDLSGGHANNFLVDNVGRALVDKLVVKYSGTILQDAVGYDIYKIFEDLFLSKEERDNMLQDGIQSVGLNKIRSNAGDKQTSGVDTENKLKKIYGSKYRIRLDHQILNDHGTFYPQALFNDLVFELTLAPADRVVKGSDPSKLKYKLTNIQLEYEMIRAKHWQMKPSARTQVGKNLHMTTFSVTKWLPLKKAVKQGLISELTHREGLSKASCYFLSSPLLLEQGSQKRT